MEYIYTDKDNNKYFYNVEFDETNLRKILEILSDFSYVCFCRGQIAGRITRFPATNKSLFNRINRYNFNNEKTIYKNSIIHHTENDCDYVTYEYSYSKLPNLYDYIDLLINDKNILTETRLFGNVNGQLNMLYVVAHKEQCILDALFDYIDSYELSDINKYNYEEDQFGNCYYQNFDHDALRKLYKETLDCFTFSLISTKEKIDNNGSCNYVMKRKK